MIPFRPIPKPSPRKRPSLSEKLAACLCHMMAPEGGPMVPGAASMTVKQINASVQFHHEKPRELMGSDHPTNIVPQPSAYHIEVQTPKDRKPIDKSRRNRKAEEAFRARILAKQIGDDPPRDVKRFRIKSRGFPKRQFRGGKRNGSQSRGVSNRNPPPS